MLIAAPRAARHADEKRHPGATGSQSSGKERSEGRDRPVNEPEQPGLNRLQYEVLIVPGYRRVVNPAPTIHRTPHI